MKRIQKTALITGGWSGLGRAISEELLRDRWRVVSIDRRTVREEDGVLHIACDLGDRRVLDRAVPAILAAGPFDLVVFNAGISATGKFTDVPGEAYANLVRINAETPMVLAATLLQNNAMTGRGALVFISSLSHFTGYPGAAVFAATKDAIAVYAKSIREACAARGISVSVAFPGPILTEHAARHAPDGASAASRMTPEEAARRILSGVFAGRHTIVPGAANRAYALAGRLAPASVTRIMRRIVFDKLKEARW